MVRLLFIQALYNPCCEASVCQMLDRMSFQHFVDWTVRCTCLTHTRCGTSYRA